MLRAVFFDVGNTLVRPHPSVSEVVRQVLAEEGHIHDLSAIDELMPLVDEYYEDRYRDDDTFWTDEDRTSQVWVGMYSLLCRRLGIETTPSRSPRACTRSSGTRAAGRPTPTWCRRFGGLQRGGSKLG